MTLFFNVSGVARRSSLQERRNDCASWVVIAATLLFFGIGIIMAAAARKIESGGQSNPPKVLLSPSLVENREAIEKEILLSDDRFVTEQLREGQYLGEKKLFDYRNGRHLRGPSVGKYNSVSYEKENALDLASLPLLESRCIQHRRGISEADTEGVVPNWFLSRSPTSLEKKPRMPGEVEWSVANELAREGGFQVERLEMAASGRGSVEAVGGFQIFLDCSLQRRPRATHALFAVANGYGLDGRKIAELVLEEILRSASTRISTYDRFVNIAQQRSSQFTRWISNNSSREQRSDFAVSELFRDADAAVTSKIAPYSGAATMTAVIWDILAGYVYVASVGDLMVFAVDHGRRDMHRISAVHNFNEELEQLRLLHRLESYFGPNASSRTLSEIVAYGSSPDPSKFYSTSEQPEKSISSAELQRAEEASLPIGAHYVPKHPNSIISQTLEKSYLLPRSTSHLSLPPAARLKYNVFKSPYRSRFQVDGMDPTRYFSRPTLPSASRSFIRSDAEIFRYKTASVDRANAWSPSLATTAEHEAIPFVTLRPSANAAKPTKMDRKTAAAPDVSRMSTLVMTTRGIFTPLLDNLLTFHYEAQFGNYGEIAPQVAEMRPNLGTDRGQNKLDGHTNIPHKLPEKLFFFQDDSMRNPVEEYEAWLHFTSEKRFGALRPLVESTSALRQVALKDVTKLLFTLFYPDLGSCCYFRRPNPVHGILNSTGNTYANSKPFSSLQRAKYGPPGGPNMAVRTDFHFGPLRKDYQPPTGDDEKGMNNKVAQQRVVKNDHWSSTASHSTFPKKESKPLRPLKNREPIEELSSDQTQQFYLHLLLFLLYQHSSKTSDMLTLFNFGASLLLQCQRRDLDICLDKTGSLTFANTVSNLSRLTAISRILLHRHHHSRLDDSLFLRIHRFE